MPSAEDACSVNGVGDFMARYGYKQVLPGIKSEERRKRKPARREKEGGKTNSTPKAEL